MKFLIISGHACKTMLILILMLTLGINSKLVKTVLLKGLLNTLYEGIDSCCIILTLVMLNIYIFHITLSLEAKKCHANTIECIKLIAKND